MLNLRSHFWKFLNSFILKTSSACDGAAAMGGGACKPTALRGKPPKSNTKTHESAAVDFLDDLHLHPRYEYGKKRGALYYQSKNRERGGLYSQYKDNREAGSSLYAIKRASLSIPKIKWIYIYIYISA